MVNCLALEKVDCCVNFFQRKTVLLAIFLISIQEPKHPEWQLCPIRHIPVICKDVWVFDSCYLWKFLTASANCIVIIHDLLSLNRKFCCKDTTKSWMRQTFVRITEEGGARIVTAFSLFNDDSSFHLFIIWVWRGWTEGEGRKMILFLYYIYNINFCAPLFQKCKWWKDEKMNSPFWHHLRERRVDYVVPVVFNIRRNVNKG